MLRHSVSQPDWSTFSPDRVRGRLHGECNGVAFSYAPLDLAELVIGGDHVKFQLHCCVCPTCRLVNRRSRNISDLQVGTISALSRRAKTKDTVSFGVGFPMTVNSRPHLPHCKRRRVSRDRTHSCRANQHITNNKWHGSVTRSGVRCSNAPVVEIPVSMEECRETATL